jgi:hypothetical protein
MMKTANLAVVAVVAVCSFVAQGANAATIYATVQSVSSELQMGYDRGGAHALNGDGLTGGMFHTSTANSTMWTTTGNGVAGSAVDYSPSLTVNLNGLYDISAMNVWNYNEMPHYNTLGAKDVEVFTGATLGSMVSQGLLTFAVAPGTSGFAGETIAVNYSGVQYIRFDIKTNWDNAVFNGTGAIGGTVDGRSITGLSEVNFEGTLVVAPLAPAPEPSTLVLASLSLVGMLVARRRYRG